MDKNTENTTADPSAENEEVETPSDEKQEEKTSKPLEEMSPEELAEQIKFWKRQSRKQEDANKALKASAQKWEEFQESQKTELQKAIEKAQKLEAEIAKTKLEAEVLKVQKKYALPDESVALLSKSTIETIDEDAKILASLVKSSQKEEKKTLPVNPLQGQKATETKSNSMASSLREAFKTINL